VIERILLAVDDSPSALAAATVAIDLARRLNAQLLAVNVLADHLLSTMLARASADPEIAVRRDSSAASVLGHVAHMADRAGVALETQLLEGDVARLVLRTARTWHADLLVVGHSDQRAPGEPYVGSQTAHILEFAEQPVLVVPRFTRDAPVEG
jgi:nucleotide-binding universal stress UspA family protein